MLCVIFSEQNDFITIKSPLAPDGGTKKILIKIEKFQILID